jgi:2-keto-4-pentenoate hydratase
MTGTNVEKVARSIIGAYSDGPIAPVRDLVTDTAQAYSVQQATVRHWLQQGRRIAGRKIGLTSKAVQQQLGVDEPDYGTIFADMIANDRAVIPSGAVLQPRVEAEIAFVLASDLDGANATPESVIAATQYVTPALEICGSRIAGWDIRIQDTIADNASAGMIVLGNARHKAVLDDLPNVPMQFHQNGAMSIEGTGAACLGNPAIAVAWLAREFARLGESLRAGDIVMSGALARMASASPGDQFHADFGSFGSVSVSFAR